MARFTQYIGLPQKASVFIQEHGLVQIATYVGYIGICEDPVSFAIYKYATPEITLEEAAQGINPSAVPEEIWIEALQRNYLG
jgi:hypothetical protein